MSILNRPILILLLIHKWIEVIEASKARSYKFQKVNTISTILNKDGLPVKKGPDSKHRGSEVSQYWPKTSYGSVLTPVLEKYERYRGQLGLNLQLDKIKLYYAVDYANQPIVSQYPKDQKCEGYKAQNQFSKIKRPNYYTLVRDFLNLFTPDKEEKGPATYKLRDLDTGLPDAVMMFMDPNTCAHHIVELNKQDKEARISSTKLNRVYKLFGAGLNFYRDSETVDLVVPFSESLVYATNKGGSNFTGTPVFTTDPPIYVSKNKDSTQEGESGGAEDKFNQEDKLLVFFTPTEAKEFYKKVRWQKNYKDEVTGKVYRIWSNSPSFRPEVKVTSLEKIYNRVHGPEPFWGYVLEFMEPNIRLEKRTEFMLKESKNWLLVPWYSLRKVWRGIVN